MITRHRTFAIAGSLALHAVAVGIAIVAGSARDLKPPALFIDLSQAGAVIAEPVGTEPGRPAVAPAPRRLRETVRQVDTRAPAVTPRVEHTRANAPAPPPRTPAVPEEEEPSLAPVSSPLPMSTAIAPPAPPDAKASLPASIAVAPAPARLAGEDYASPAAASDGTGRRPAHGTDGEHPVGAVGQGGLGAAGLLPLEVGGNGRLGTEYDGYLAALRQQIHERLAYPYLARRRGLAGTVLLEIVVQPTGVIQGVSVVSASLHSILDEAAVAAVKAVAPIPFPSGVARRVLRVRLPIVFELQVAR